MAGHAQSASGFALDRFDPAERGSDFFEEDTLDLRGEARPAAGFTIDWAHKPLVIYNQDGSERTAPVKDQLFGHLGGDLVLMNRLRLGLNIPVALYQAGSAGAVNGTAFSAATKAALGDPRLGVDVRLFGQHGDPLTLAAGARVYLPLGSTAQYAGDGKVRIQPHLLVAGRPAELFEYAGHLGFTYRALEQTVDGAPVGSELQFGLAGGLRPMPELLIGPEVYGSTVVVEGGFFKSRSTAFEALFGGHYTLGDWKLGAGVGPGLTQGLGEPEFRGLFSLDWAPRYLEPVHDRDHDGIADAQDACPDQAGIHTGDPATEGCPDTDRDGIVDARDACPDKAGVPSSDPKLNGCPPPPPDSDGDGIPDAQDACPNAKGAPNANPKKNGCPPDLDGDGIPDAQDACPEIPGVASSDPHTNGCPGDRDHDGIRDDQDKCPDQPGIAELQGCPDVDSDGDGVPDRLDNCPKEPGPKENGGCPAKQKQLVVITREKLDIKDKVYFDSGKASIQKRSFKLLDSIAEVIKKHPEMKKLRIEGHTDNAGKPAKNKKLSQDRAESVKAYLVKRGVEAGKLEAEGYGQEKPIDTNKTAAGRANNRRVEFFIVHDEAPAAHP